MAPLRQVAKSFAYDKTASKEEEQGVEGLVLGGSGDLPPNGQIGEERFGLLLSYFLGIPFVVEEDKSFNRKDIGLFSGPGVVFPSNRLTDLIEKFFRRGHFSLDWFQNVKYCIRQCINLFTLS